MEEILLNYIKNIHENDASGHDLFHVRRVVNLAKYLQKEEGGNAQLIELAAWLHDVGDYKLHNGIDKTEELVSDFFEKYPQYLSYKENTLKIIKQVSYKGGFNEKPSSIEAKIVQDADRLDAIGAIGIARTFAYGGSKGTLMYDNSVVFEDSKNKEEYEKKNHTTIHHFYDKLLKLKHLMNTDTAKKLAKKRDKFMKKFLKEFYTEWNF